MPQLLLVRHGQASFGGPDYDVLSALGARQAAVTRAALDARGVRPARSVRGSLKRQADTAAAWADLGEVVVDPRWDEYDAGDVLGAHGHPGTSLETPGADAGGAVDSRAFQAVLDHALTAWVRAGDDSAARETWPAFRDRIAGGLHDAAAALGSGEAGLVVSSGGVIAVCCVLLTGLPPEHLVTFNRVAINAGITKVAVGRGGLTLVSFNEHAHLDPDGLVTYR